MLGLSVGTSGALTLLTPLAARAHVGVLIALRIAIGMAEVKNTNFSLLFIDTVSNPLSTFRTFYDIFYFWWMFFLFFLGICIPSRTCTMESVGSSFRKKQTGNTQPRRYISRPLKILSQS